MPAEARTTTKTESAVAWRRARHAEICDDVRRWEHGTAVRCTSMPEWWDYNSVRVEGPDPGIDAEALIAAADTLQRGMRHRQVEVEDQAAGERLRPEFEARGWSVERLVWMARNGPVPAGADFEEVPFADTRFLRAEWMSALPWMNDDAATARFLTHEETVAELRGSRTLITRDDGGTPSGYVSFGARSGAAEVEQVYVTPERRGGGIGGALVAAALRASGATETFIVADDEGDPKRLYERLGFAPVWIQHVFLTRPG